MKWRLRVCRIIALSAGIASTAGTRKTGKSSCVLATSTSGSTFSPRRDRSGSFRAARSSPKPPAHVILFETGPPTRRCVPKEDVRLELLAATPRVVPARDAPATGPSPWAAGSGRTLPGLTRIRFPNVPESRILFASAPRAWTRSWSTARRSSGRSPAGRADRHAARRSRRSATARTRDIARSAGRSTASKIVAFFVKKHMFQDMEHIAHGQFVLGAHRIR